MKATTILFLLSMFFGGCNYHGNGSDNSTARIKTIIEQKSKDLIEVATKLDMDSIITFYDKDVSAIEQGHMHSNSRDFISSYKSALESVAEVHQIDIVDPRIKVLSEQVAIYEAKLEQDITLKNGQRIEAINVLTLVYNWTDEDWKIVHHHGSFPVE
ncbi:MAG: nuclear transport factor 2 family protein [Cyclobacteriaceae bacterium]